MAYGIKGKRTVILPKVCNPPLPAVFIPPCKASFGGGKPGAFASVVQLRVNKGSARFGVSANFGNVAAALEISRAKVTHTDG